LTQPLGNEAKSGIVVPQVNPITRTGFVIPTYNAGEHWDHLYEALERQSISKEQVVIVDSTSSDSTRQNVRWAGYKLLNIPKASFSHGATRQMATEYLPWADFFVFLTQDAIPCGDNSIEQLLRFFNDPEVGAVYGRQLPRSEADAIETHARLFNYPATSDVRSFSSRMRLGFRAAYFSNSFAAYRRTALEAVGGFPKDTIVSEEVTVSARMLIAGWKIGYNAEATAIHSHPLSIRQEFSRYFDIGVHHGREKWLLEAFGGVAGEGNSFVKSEMRYLLKNNPSLIPLAVLRNGSKWCAYHLGMKEKHLPAFLKRYLSSHPGFWKQYAASSPSPSPVATRNTP
jgi:rhamnosyltransferase